MKDPHNTPAKTFDNVVYNPPKWIRSAKNSKSLTPIGLDTEAYKTGKCFMLCTSEGDVMLPEDLPGCLFTHKNRSKSYVVWNLKYDSGAIIQILPAESIKELQETDETECDGYKYISYANKTLIIRHGKYTVNIYDVAGFYNLSLQAASMKYLQRGKMEVETKSFTQSYVTRHWDKIKNYCIQDAILTRDLTQILLRKFEGFGVYPKKLYSTAYVSWKYFSTNCPYVHVKRYWDKYPEVLNYAMQAYNGGKFEVTRKGPDYYYEYDIVSAYPYEISNLVDIRKARVTHSKTYRKSSVYGFLKCHLNIPLDLPSPVALKHHNLNRYPSGEFTKVITKQEYEYLTAYGADVDIIDAYYLDVSRRTHPYRYEIQKLVGFKKQYKKEMRVLDYQTIKTFLNSFYGKFIQLVEEIEQWKAGAAWNPVYGAIITANCRIRISALQRQYKEIIAVHTDSVISTEKLPGFVSKELGDVAYDCEGKGIILGSGIYQVGDKSRFRGFDLRTPLISVIPDDGKYLSIVEKRPYSWREIVHRNLDPRNINRFEAIEKKLYIRFDKKRIWLDDYNDFSEVKDRVVTSLPVHQSIGF